MGLLPTTKSSIASQDPKNLIIFSAPKCGKTSALAQLDDCLIIDMEDGTDYVSGYVIKAKTYVELFNIAKELKVKEHKFKFVALDTITALEDIASVLARKMYMELPIGANFDPNGNILNLPNGAGYQA